MKKGFISLEYILIFSAVLMIFSVLLITIDNLYNKNLSAIDTKNLYQSSTKIQEIISFQELQTISLNKIKLNPNDCWYFKKISSKEISLENKKNVYKIYSRKTIILQEKEVCSERYLIIKKDDNNIYLYLE